MNDNDFLRLLEAAVVVAKPVSADAIDIDDMDMSLVDAGIDSLDMLMIGICMTDVFGVGEEEAKTMQVGTPREMREFLLKHATVDVIDVDKAIAELK